MKFALESTCYHRNDMLEKYPFLVDYGFEIEEKAVGRKTRIRDENGDIVYQFSTRIETIPCIHIDTLEQLVDFSAKVGKENSIIIFPTHTVYNGAKGEWESVGFPAIEIYDGYRE